MAISEQTRKSFREALDTLEPLWKAGYDEGVSRRGTAPEKSLKECICKTVASRFADTHIIYQDTTWTFAQSNETACRLANALDEQGCKKGDRVIVMLDNIPELIVSFMACYKTGLIVVGLNPRSTVEEIQTTLLDCTAETIVITLQRAADLKALVKEGSTALKRVIVVSETPIEPQDGFHRFSDLVVSGSKAEPDTSIKPDDVAMLLYTGGTTGICKGCPLTQRELIHAQYLFGGIVKPLLHDARSMTSLVTSPMTHAYGMNFGINWGIVIGGTVVLAQSLTASSIAKLIESHQPQVWGAVPALMDSLNNDPEAGTWDLSALKVVVVSCAASSSEVIRKFQERFHIKVIEDYGMTETAGPVSLTPVLLGASAGSVGLPTCDTDVLVVDIETGCHPLPFGKRGEIIFRGPQVIDGYWRNLEETARTFRDEWIYSGDVGYFDTEGYLFVVDRIKDVISVGGFSVFPRDIDEVLISHPSIAEACSIGVFDKHSGERPKSFVVLKGGETLTEQAIIDYCHEHLIAYKCPKYIEFITAIPRTQLGKPDKEALKEKEKENGFYHH
jgi:long-chain acyl-CoA synthetase